MAFNKKNKKQIKNSELLKFQPKSFVDAKEMAAELRKGNVLIVDFESVNENEILRIVDFVSGVLYAINGKHKRISSKTYLLSPSVELLNKFSNDLY